MNAFLKKCLLLAAALIPAETYAQDIQGFVHEQSDASKYIVPADKEVIKKLEEWRDLKFGVLIHFGLYSLPGIVESWSICSEDVDWITRKENLPYDEYKKWYWGLSKKFNPSEIDPDAWASLMRDAGMKYVIFTTKHHDGYCLFDSKLTDFSIAHGPFASNPKKDLAAHVFRAFRDRGFMTGCYFSKPDWHCQWFWNPDYATPTRHINYKKERHPDWWKNYQDFTSGQLGELLGGRYGRMDILWLDGGWIAGDDFGLGSIVEKARATLHPGMISVDRTIGGPYENYTTPERGIPAHQLLDPWESCIPLSNDWGWVPNAPYKSPEKVIGLLAEIVAKGGCFVLGVGPTSLGTIEPEAEWRLRKIGEWLEKNGEAIYRTRPTSIYHDGDTWFTASKDGKTIYAIWTPSENTENTGKISWEGNVPKGTVRMLEGNEKLKHTVGKDGRVEVWLPKNYGKIPVAMKFNVK